MPKKFKRVTKTETVADRQRRDKVRAQVVREFPPKQRTAVETANSVGQQIRKAREEQGLTWYAVAKAAGVPNSGTVRSIEQGQDAKLSSVQAIAKALGLKIDIVAA